MKSIKNYQIFFVRTPCGTTLIQSTSIKSELGRALAKDMAHYWSNKKPNPYGSLIMADVLTIYAGVLYPELIKSTMPVEFCFNPNKYYHNPETQVEEPIDASTSQNALHCS